MPHRLAIVLACAVLLLGVDAATPRPAAAESSVELIAGGLLFAGNPLVRIDRQEVLITRDRITVTYALRNTSNTPQAIHIAFPLPDIDAMAVADEELALPARDAANFVQSQTTVDGQPVTLKLEQRAVALALDVTTTLRDAGFDLFPYASANAGKPDALSPELRLDLLERGILKDDGASIAPAWTLKSVAHWRQPLLADQTITIVHSYQPVTANADRSDEAIAAHRKRSCLTPSQESALAALPSVNGAPPTMTTIGYAASPAADALGPIARFRLIVESADANVVVASCREGLRRTGPMQLEWSATDVSLDEDIHIMMAR